MLRVVVNEPLDALREWTRGVEQSLRAKVPSVYMVCGCGHRHVVVDLKGCVGALRRTLRVTQAGRKNEMRVEQAGKAREICAMG